MNDQHLTDIAHRLSENYAASIDDVQTLLAEARRLQEADALATGLFDGEPTTAADGLRLLHQECLKLAERCTQAAARLPTWQDGPPPRTEPGEPVYVWREGYDAPVPVLYSEGSRERPHGMYWLPPENREMGRYEPWGTARWAPIPKPA